MSRGGAQARVSRRLAGALALATAAVVAIAVPGAIATGGGATVVKVGNLQFTIDGAVAPRVRSRTVATPVSLTVSGKVATADGSHPPPLEKLIFDTDRNGTIDTLGVPVCRKPELEARTTTVARRVCDKAIVGTGLTDVEVVFPESRPIQVHSRLTAFNGGTDGGTTTIFIHAYLSQPISAAIVTTVKVTGEHRGRYGTHSVATVPKIANGAGSVTAFDLTFQKRLFAYRGKKHGYLVAKCSDGRFDAQVEAIFATGTKLGGRITRACTPKG
jgi:hypothetical protein